jgi:diguanylate cyclase (GGDEF)-like protein/PAS domain S-box-containing protein
MSAPQDRTMENPAQERQNEVRNRVLKKAQIVFKGRGAVIDCVVLNLADGNACLKVESPIGIPDSFDLVIDNATVGNCRVTWRKATQIGVEFVLSTTVDKHLALKAAHEAERLRRSADHLARAQRIAQTGSIEQDLRTGVIEWSGETYRIFGLDPNLPAPVGEAFLALVHPDDRAACETQAFAHQASAAGQLHDKPRVSLRFRIVQPGGAVRWVHHESELVLDRHGAAVRWIGTYRDVTEAFEAEARIAHMAHHDALTDLPNRVLFHERLDEALLRVRRHEEKLAVLYLDLDRFKNVNDTLGHAAGDKLLVAVAKRLRNCMRDSDVAARFGGDEFAVLQLGLAGPHEAGALAERIVTHLSEPYEIEGQQAAIGASAGIALAPTDGETSEQLLGNADMALYRAKEEGRGTFRFFEPGMDAHFQAGRALELDSRNALAAGEFG